LAQGSEGLYSVFKMSGTKTKMELEAHPARITGEYVVFPLDNTRLKLEDFTKVGATIDQ